MMDEKCQFLEDICGMSDEMFEIIYLSFLSSTLSWVNYFIGRKWTILIFAKLFKIRVSDISFLNQCLSSKAHVTLINSFSEGFEALF